ncbi:cytochrome c [Ferribacterium limneticum]|uniref:cytochrome c n=1 Tax=Ferribacterium limneticum TaxID=76259 RepID=UPI001CFBE8F8|nr:cytochrome c [Ferribacterium limneticum]UCV19389.1 cytochrome c [Ferribacterium limneticum]
MKPAAVFLGLACVVLAPGALGTTQATGKAVVVKKAVAAKKKPVVKKTVAAKKTTPAKMVQPAPVALPAAPDNFNDERELIRMPSPARLALRAEMRDRMAALDTVLQRLNEGRVVEAGQIAQFRLGVAVWWNHTKLPANTQPEQYMPQKMQDLALDGYMAASDFATVALTGDQQTATAMLPQLTGSCAQCHQAYRIR